MAPTGSRCGSFPVHYSTCLYVRIRSVIFWPRQAQPRVCRFRIERRNSASMPESWFPSPAVGQGASRKGKYLAFVSPSAWPPSTCHYARSASSRIDSRRWQYNLWSIGPSPLACPLRAIRVPIWSGCWAPLVLACSLLGSIRRLLLTSSQAALRLTMTAGAQRRGLPGEVNGCMSRSRRTWPFTYAFAQVALNTRSTG
jgi:hypothetical protein